MAFFFGVNHGADEFSVTTGATTTSKDVEVVINTNANVPSKEALMLAMRKIERYMIRQSKQWV